ncbi:MAG: [Fe-S]-binding protein, partial [Desulfatitalea sp.]
MESPGWVIRVTLPPPSLQDNTGDCDRLCRALRQELRVDQIHISLALRKQLPALLREAGYAVRCVVFQERGCAVLVHVAADQSGELLCGLAVDLGTTRVVLRLVDLEQRTVLAESGFDNPQIAIGPDVLARIHATDSPGGLDRLQQLIVQGLNQQTADLCRSQAVSMAAVHLVSAAGNTAMSHLLAGLPVHWMIREPYIPAANRFGLIPAAEVGLEAHPLAQMLLFPCVGSYF